ncbi:MAG: type II secretion system protein [Chthoniobacterales bacterium]
MKYPIDFPRIRGFSIVELLVVLAVIGILTSFVVSAASGLTERGSRTKCLSNLRQIGVAMHLYAGENNGRLPSSSHHRAAGGSSLSWTNTLSEYLGKDFLGRCPSTPNHRAAITYGWNDFLTDTNGSGVSVLTASTPAATLAVAELATNQTSEHFHFRGSPRGRVTANQFKSAVNVECHGTSANYLFLDGHAENLAWSVVQTRLGKTNNLFLEP